MTDIGEVFGNPYNFGLQDLDGGPEQTTISLVEAATGCVMQKYRFLTVQETREVLYYEQGVYVPGGEILIAKEAEKVFGYKLTKGKLSEIIAHIMRRTYHKREELDTDINVINLKNGLYDIYKDLLLPHKPEYFSVNQKPITFDKNAKPKLFGQFLGQVLYGRDIRTAVEAMAYTFHRDYIIEVIFMLHGLGANGKTVYTSVITGLHGSDNVSNVPLSDMLSDKFAISDFEGKDVNIDNELAGQTVKETAVLKRVTGGSRQRIRIQRKNERAYDATLYAKLFFSANKIPESQDTSDAYNRRIIIIVFPFRFEGRDEDKQLLSKLTTSEEISGIFNVLMAALRRIRVNGDLYVNEKTIEEKRRRYEMTVNPVASFWREAVCPNHGGYITKLDLYNGYTLYCRRQTLPIEKFDNFCKIMKNKFEVKEFRPQIDGKRVQCWAGIGLVPDYAPKTEQTTII